MIAKNKNQINNDDRKESVLFDVPYDEDVILNEIGESEDENDECDNGESVLTFVPKIKFITRHGRAAGTCNSYLRK